MFITKSRICGFHGGDISSRRLLGGDAVWCCGRTQNIFALKMEAA